MRSEGSDIRKVGKKGAKREIIRVKGSLKSHINIGTRLSKRQAAKNRKLGKAEVEVHVGTRDRVGRLQEFGTHDTPAQPFMRPAWDSEGNETALSRIGDEMWAEVGKSAGRQAMRRARG
jgi:HK97 gp10 family phage protein